MGYGSEIKALIKGNGMTIKELSEKSGVSINTLYSITKRDSKRIDEDTRNKISSVIDIHPVEKLDAQKCTGVSDRAIKSLTGDDELVKAVNYLLSREKGVDAIKGVYAFFQKW